MRYKKLRCGRRFIEALQIPLSKKNFVLLRGRKGYIMCGYLNLASAEKFGDLAIKITGVATIEEALVTTVHSCTSAAKKLGIRKGQTVKEVLSKII